MPETNTDITLRIQVLDRQGKPLGGKVNIDCKPKEAGATIRVKEADASKDIDVSGLQRDPKGAYTVTVSPTDGARPASQAVNIPTRGFAALRFVFTKDPGSQVDPQDPTQYKVQGNLVFDHGLPAAGITVRLYGVGFAGKDVRLGEAKANAQGVYSIPYNLAAGVLPNVQVRVLDSDNKEVTISNTKFSVHPEDTLNLVVPGKVQPLASEFQRLAADMEKAVGGVAKLGEAQESSDRQDLTLLNRSTNWDARLVAFAAAAAQQTATTGMGQDVLYALFRVGLPTDTSLLSLVPSDTVNKALAKASKAGIVSLSDQQITAATNAFKAFASKTQLTLTTPGAVSSFGDLLANTLPDANQRAAFANLYLTQPSDDLWAEAAKLKIPAEAISALKLQGKFLHLTWNNAPLAQKLQQEIGAEGQPSQIVKKDYHRSETWQKTITGLAGAGGDKALEALIPAIYPGKTAADRLAAYTADLARKVRIGFPTEVVARMIETKDLPLQGNTSDKVSAFLNAAAPTGYKLGQTPLNAFLKKSPAGVPALDADSTASLKTLHRLFQITPSNESLQVAMKLGFTSAQQIASYTKDEFNSTYASAFPPGEATLIYGHSQTLSSVTFNIFGIAKQLDTQAPAYAFSALPADRDNAKKAIVQQFPSMASLFGNLDFCQCEDCRSVLSPAAYFVDALEFLAKSPPNAKNFTPLDVLVGSSDGAFSGRRPDLAALPLTCENTNTALPYIDLVNEILEYYIAYSKLDSHAAYDTGEASTADLIAEPQHILPQVYNGPLKQAVYPLTLPFDLWIETVRGFLNYFKIPLAKVLEALRPADTLELFTDGQNRPYYRAQILSESLGISPAEYGVLTVLDPATQNPSVQNWFKLYGYADEATAMGALKSAKVLSQRLGLTYQELTDMVTTGFLNPALYPLIFQFRRFGIAFSDAFGFTGQPGFPMTVPAKAVFQAQLDAIQKQYKDQNPSSTFDATAWLTNLLPANYSRKVLVLADPNSGCDFSGTALQYADGNAATALDYLKFNLFARLWKNLGWTLDETDRSLQLFFPANLPAWGDANFAAAFSSYWKTALVYLAHLDDLNTQLAPALGRTALLPIWGKLVTQGDDPLYAQLFLNAGVLNSDWAFDDPRGLFPAQSADFPAASLSGTLSSHQATIQGVLGLTADEIAAILVDADVAVETVNIIVNGNNIAVPGFTLTNLSICYRYSVLAKCLQLSVSDLIALKSISGLNPFQPVTGNPIAALIDDVLYNQLLLFVKQVAVVQNSSFTVEDLKYLLRQQFDPVGKYQTDPNTLIALVQTLANGLRQIQTQNAVPANLASMPESLVDQTLSSLFPAPILKGLFTQLTDSQTYTATAAALPANKIDPAPFTQQPDISFSYDQVSQTQSVTYKGLLLNWKKAQLLALNNSALFSGLLDQLQTRAQVASSQRIGDFLGVWASLVEYEAVNTGVANPLPADILMSKDSALTLTYDQSGGLQWLGYRGVLTDTKKGILTGLALTPQQQATLTALLNKIQQQALPTYRKLVGSILAMWVNVHTYVNTQASAARIDPGAFFQALADAQQQGVITDPVPGLQFNYDPAAQMQTLSCTGVLTDAVRGQLANLPPASPVLAALLQNVRNQAVQEFQFLATNLLTVAAADLDAFALSFIGIDGSKQQSQVKAQLVQAFLPMISRKLSRQLILQTLSSNLAADPSLTEALVTDAALLSSPSAVGQSLLDAFLAVGNSGVSAAYYGSADGTGNAKASGIAVTADTADPTNNNLPIASAHFEGYLQVPTDGPYRFFAVLGDAGAAATFRLDSPDPTGLFNNPVISPTAAANAGDEFSQFVQLKGGAAYHFTLDLANLGTHGAKLLVQGETLAKGPLSQIILYPQQSVVNVIRANTLLAKVFQILQVTGLDEREITYLVANAKQFNDLKLSALPTLPSDDSLANAAKLFSQFLALADYADLRKGPAGGSNGLIDVFQAAAQNAPQEPYTPWTVLANLTRRKPQVVRDVATALGPDPHFSNNVGIRRIWEVLQILQTVAIPVPSLTAGTAIASLKPPASPTPDQIAANFKSAVQAQYTPAQWRPIAQSVFDKLRQKKRDALTAYLLNDKILNLQNIDQLFEYFLVDPGMEPVVQTSRLRLAMSSVQTFVQRCLLNLENANADPARNVAPSAIDTDTWEWMKRYRVWEANRKIFLFPENWMEPELRLDKSDLFQALESTLLQGDVTNDLVEDALLAYLKGLDVRARLDIVASYLEQDSLDPGKDTLHVVGRSYSQPHQYFYRTYVPGDGWSAWQTVGLKIEGSHIVLAMWRGRLNLFWVTFIAQAKLPASSSGPNGGAVSNLTFNQLAANVFGSNANRQYLLQLHWSEYVKGKWSNPIASDVNRSQPIAVTDDLDPSMVYIRVSKEVADNGGEGAVNIHLDFPSDKVSDLAYLIARYFWNRQHKNRGPEPLANYVFRVTSKNCDPVVTAAFFDFAPPNPYDASGVDATQRTGSAVLNASFQSNIGTNNSSTTENEVILQAVNNFALLPCGNPVVPSPLLDQNEPLYQEAGSLVSPFFFKDTADSAISNELTFFVQPSLTETVTEWTEWAIHPTKPSRERLDPVIFDMTLVDIVAQWPVQDTFPPDPGDPVYSVYPMQDTRDWLTNPATAIAYGDVAVGKNGGLNLTMASPAPSAGMPGLSSSLAVGRGAVLVDKQGLNLSHLQNIKAAQSASSITNLAGLSQTVRS